MSSPFMATLEDNEDEDMAAKAYASIAAHLQTFTSPKLGSLPPKSSYNDSMMDDDDDDDEYMDSVEWMKQDLQQVAAASPAATPLRRTPILERADTPVMSNSSSKRKSSPSASVASSEIQAPVRTPAGFQVTPRAKVHAPFQLHSAAPTKITLATTKSQHQHPNQSPVVYRRYHDTLLNYRNAKRSLGHSLDLEKKGQGLMEHVMTLVPDQDAGATGTTVASSLTYREQRIEMDFLSQLHQLCWSTTPSPETSFSEGDCWLLLLTLRRLGLSALVWDNDVISATQNARAQTAFLQQLANSDCSLEENEETTTPSQLLQRLASNQAPLVLQRRYSILQWIQTCLDHVRVPPKTARNASYGSSQPHSHPDDSEAPNLIPEASQQHQLTMLQASLSFILAGRLDDAKALVRSNGQPWRAATWSGGQPLGYEKTPNPDTKTMDVQPTGNPNRFLWKRQTWKNGRRLSSFTASSNNNNSMATVEAAISALLANDVATCLANPHLRSWSKALGATLMALWGRLEDEVLHLYNTQQRQQHKQLLFPGTQYPTQESEQLMATSQLAGMTELEAIQQLLSSSPFEEIRGQGSYDRAMAAFCGGKSTIMNFLNNEDQRFFLKGEGSDDNDDDLALLRFFTHLTLFLESLQVSTTPIILTGLTEQKNRVLFRYVQYLESRPELWHLVTLYVSLLPEETIQQWYPTMLANVLDDTERQSMLESMKSLIPHLQVPLLKQTVRLCLYRSNTLDDIKCHSIQWLLYDENHAGEALICSNILLRALFLENDDDKMEVAMNLVQDILPEDLVDRTKQFTQEEAQTKKVTNARTEHLAFLSYLEAYRTFGIWKDTLADTPTNSSILLEQQQQQQQQPIDFNNLNPTEQQIATQRMIRDWARQRKKHCESLLEAAEDARRLLYNVLTHSGGWLTTLPDDEQVGGRFVVDDEEQKRRKDLEAIRSRYLTLAVNWYHQVCEETASWLSGSLDQDISSMHPGLSSRDQALQQLSLEQDESYYYQPHLWYQHALDLAILIADDRYGIHKALEPNALKDILAKLAETAVSQLMKTAANSTAAV